MTEPEKTDPDEETEEAQQPVEIDSTQHSQVINTYAHLHMWIYDETLIFVAYIQYH